MSNVIDFLERMGQDAQLRHAPKDQVANAMAEAQIDPQLRAAILVEDRLRVEAFLGARSNMVCGQVPVDDDDDDDDSPGKDDDEIVGSHRAIRRVAAAG